MRLGETVGFKEVGLIIETQEELNMLRRLFGCSVTNDGKIAELALIKDKDAYGKLTTQIHKLLGGD